MFLFNYDPEIPEGEPGYVSGHQVGVTDYYVESILRVQLRQEATSPGLWSHVLRPMPTGVTP